MGRHRIRWIAVSCLILAAASACSASPPTSRTVAEPAISSLPEVRSAAAVALPLDAYGLSAEQKALDYQARDLIIRDCMRKAGASWSGSTADAGKVLDAFRAADEATRFGLVDESIAGAYGYHGAPGLRPPVDSGKGALATCQKEAKLSLAEGAPPAEDFALSFRLPEEAAARVGNDSRYIAMVAEWRDCMKAAGYQFQSPDDAAKDARWPTDSATQAEITTALADVRCKKDVGYLSLVVALRTAYELQLIEENADAMVRLKIYYAERAKRIERLLGTTS